MSGGRVLSAQSVRGCELKPERDHAGPTYCDERGATVGDAYHRLQRESVRDTAVVHTERHSLSASWRTRGLSDGVTRPCMRTVYQVRGLSPQRGQVSTRLIRGDCAGVMVTDRARSYDARALRECRQPTGLAHVLRSISEVVQRQGGQEASVRLSDSQRRDGTA